ncbi:hypothetical protein PsorP6_015362 [Peronosclerospora sorghi]|uniref:Uncharacterized protein n=1 Tax=Peronosclerospora sorghi TaxID=230839 RepID=A0ACC0WPX0_9STRA|nr:hypothetical protein PsorP6_015362 [Peronosclerospora sorghi]
MNKVQVSRGDFTKAARKMTPALHRAGSLFVSPLPRVVKKLLKTQVMNVLRHVARHFPLFPLEKAAVDDAVTRSSNVDERMDEEEEEEEEGEYDVSIYALVHHVDCDVCHGNKGELLGCTACPGSYHRDCLSDVNETHPKLLRIESDDGSTCTTKAHAVARVALLALIDWFTSRLDNRQGRHGQQHLGPALLHALEGLTHVSLDYPSLVADAHAHGPEEALIRRLREAQTCLPSVVFLPQMDLWWQNTSDAMHLTLKMMLMSLQAQRNLPILFLACTSSTPGDHERVLAYLRALFEDDPSVARSSLVLEILALCANARRAHFEQVFTSISN